MNKLIKFFGIAILILFLIFIAYTVIINTGGINAGITDSNESYAIIPLKFLPIDFEEYTSVDCNYTILLPKVKTPPVEKNGSILAEVIIENNGVAIFSGMCIKFPNPSNKSDSQLLEDSTISLKDTNYSIYFIKDIRNGAVVGKEIFLTNYNQSINKNLFARRQLFITNGTLFEIDLSGYDISSDWFFSQDANRFFASLKIK